MPVFHHPIAIFVMSCDKTADIANHFVMAFKKYWPHCSYPVYFGTNHEQSHILALKANPLPSESQGWRLETLSQLEHIRSLDPGITHVLVFLDDFILGQTIDTERVERLISAAVAKQVRYLRLQRLEEGISSMLAWRFRKKDAFGGESVIQIRQNHPYYSSLQVALWELDHLYTSVERAKDIWAFEQMHDGTPHYSVMTSLLTYRHIVEKGEWDDCAKNWCLKTLGQFNPGKRPYRTLSMLGKIIISFKKGMFSVFGYLPSRLKQRLLLLIRRIRK